MANPIDGAGGYPLLEALLAQRGMSLKGIYTYRVTAQIFDVSVRTIQEWIREEKLQARNLPGRGRFLSEDLEDFLINSRKRRKGAR
jgi:transposase